MKVVEAKHRLGESDAASIPSTSTDAADPANAIDGMAADIPYGMTTHAEHQAGQTASSEVVASNGPLDAQSTPENVAAPQSLTDGSDRRVERQLNFDLLLQESWASYLAAKETGTPAQRVTALKAVYDHLSHHERLQVSEVAHPFSSLSDDALLIEVKRLMTLLAPTLGLAADWHA